MEPPSLHKMMADLAAGFLGSARLSRNPAAQAAFEVASERVLDALEDFQSRARRYNATQIEREVAGRIGGLEQRAEALPR